MADRLRPRCPRQRSRLGRAGPRQERAVRRDADGVGARHADPVVVVELPPRLPHQFVGGGRRLAGIGRRLGGEHRRQPLAGGHRRPARCAEQPGGFGIGGLEQSEPDAGVVAVSAGRWQPAEQPRVERVPDRFMERDPPVHQVAEGLGHPVDVGRPHPPGHALVEEPPLVLAEPPRQRRVGQAGPGLHSGRPDRPAGCAGTGDLVDVELPGGERLEPGPLERDPQRTEAVVGQQPRRPRRTGRRSRCHRQTAAPTLPLPTHPSPTPVPRPRCAATKWRRRGWDGPPMCCSPPIRLERVVLGRIRSSFGLVDPRA